GSRGAWDLPGPGCRRGRFAIAAAGAARRVRAPANGSRRALHVVTAHRPDAASNAARFELPPPLAARSLRNFRIEKLLEIELLVPLRFRSSCRGSRNADELRKRGHQDRSFPDGRPIRT